MKDKPNNLRIARLSTPDKEQTMTTLTNVWLRLRPYLWATAVDLNPVPQIAAPQHVARLDEIEGRVIDLEHSARVDWTKIDAYYIKVAAECFMEHMNRVEANLQTHNRCIYQVIDDHRKDLAEGIESLNRRLADAETLCGAEIAKLQKECEQNSARLEALMRRLKGLGDE